MVAIPFTNLLCYIGCAPSHRFGSRPPYTITNDTQLLDFTQSTTYWMQRHVASGDS